jgi:hypothetical protein
MLAEGVHVFAAVRDRYDGSNRNPWNEMECGSNYARSLASWSGVLVLSGFGFDARCAHLRFAPKLRAGLRFSSIWSNGLAWGTFALEAGGCALRVLGGQTRIASLGLPFTAGAAVRASLNDADLDCRLSDGALIFDALVMREGDVLRVGSPALAIAALPDVAEL